MVIPGWDEAFALLRVGSQAIIIIPPEMAYGENGAPPVIPPDATLVFEVALLEVFDGPDPIDLPDFTVPDDAEIIETRSGLLIVILEWGEGPLPQEGDTVSVLYVGTLEEDETEFDNAYLRGTPIEFPVGEGYVIPGWDEALLLMPEGTRAVLIIPPDLAYGEEGAPPVIPSDAVLRFGIDLVKVTPADDQ
jgi:peptidylprolyl isomerase